MSDAPRGLLYVVRARLPSQPRRAADHGAQAADLADKLRRMRSGKAGPPRHAPDSMMADMFQAKWYEVVSGCGSGGRTTALTRMAPSPRHVWRASRRGAAPSRSAVWGLERGLAD